MNTSVYLKNNEKFSKNVYRKQIFISFVPTRSFFFFTRKCVFNNFDSGNKFSACILISTSLQEVLINQ